MLSQDCIAVVEQLIAEKFPDDLHAFYVRDLALMIFDQLLAWYDLTRQEREWLIVAALLHDLGTLTAEKKHHKIGLEDVLKLNLPMPENEKLLVANIVRYHRKACPKLSHAYFAQLLPAERVSVIKLSAILRLADGLNRSHVLNISQLILEQQAEQIELKIITHYKHLDAEIYGFEKKKDLFEEVFKPVQCSISLV